MSNVKQMEHIETAFMTPILHGTTMSYREDSGDAHAWQCLGCGLVWEKRWHAESCETRKHVPSFAQHYYSGGAVVNGVYTGRKSTYTRKALRREPIGGAQ
jgi:hypothetical protein